MLAMMMMRKRKMEKLPVPGAAASTSPSKNHSHSHPSALFASPFKDTTNDANIWSIGAEGRIDAEQGDLPDTASIVDETDPFLIDGQLWQVLSSSSRQVPSAKLSQVSAPLASPSSYSQNQSPIEHPTLSPLLHVVNALIPGSGSGMSTSLPEQQSVAVDSEGGFNDRDHLGCGWSSRSFTKLGFTFIEEETPDDESKLGKAGTSLSALAPVWQNSAEGTTIVGEDISFDIEQSDAKNGRLRARHSLDVTPASDQVFDFDEDLPSGRAVDGDALNEEENEDEFDDNENESTRKQGNGNRLELQLEIEWRKRRGDGEMTMVPGSIDHVYGMSDEAGSSWNPNSATRFEENWKTEMCKNWSSEGKCKYGIGCHFAHGKQELRSRLRREEYKTKLCISPAHTYSGRCSFTAQHQNRCNYCHPGEAIRQKTNRPYYDHEYEQLIQEAFDDNVFPFGIFV